MPSWSSRAPLYSCRSDGHASVSGVRRTKNATFNPLAKSGPAAFGQMNQLQATSPEYHRRISGKSAISTI